MGRNSPIKSIPKLQLEDIAMYLPSIYLPLSRTGSPDQAMAAQAPAISRPTGNNANRNAQLAVAAINLPVLQGQVHVGVINERPLPVNKDGDRKAEADQVSFPFKISRITSNIRSGLLFAIR